MALASSSGTALDREFFQMRSRLIELAAAMDRIERADRDASADPRMTQMRRALEIIADIASSKAMRVQTEFSLDP